MANFVVVVVICATFCIIDKTISAPIIKASGVQWSEPKGTGKGNITLIMIPQNNSCGNGNDSDMIVAVKSDYQIVSQDTQLLNLVVNENTNNKTNTKKVDAPVQKCSNLRENSINKDEREALRMPNTAKYFEPENKLPSENTTNNTVNVYPLLLRNYQNLVNPNGTSTTVSYNTVNIFQLLNMSMTQNKYVNSNSNQLNSDVPIYSSLNTATSKYNNMNLTEPSNHSLTLDNVVRNKNDSLSLSLTGSDDNFLNDALDILEKLKQNPSYYNKFKTNQVPSTEEIKEQGDTYLTDSKTKILKSDDSALASDEGEGLSREFGHNIHEIQDISNIEGNVNEQIPNSTCLPFFMAVTSEQTTQLDSNNHTEIYLEKVPLKGTGSNVSQELIPPDNSPKCKPLPPKSAIEETPQTTNTPVEISVNNSIGYGVQSNSTPQTSFVKTCKPSAELLTQSMIVTPLATSQAGNGFVSAVSVSKAEPNYIQQTLAAAHIAPGLELSTTDSSQRFVSAVSAPVSGYDNYSSKVYPDCLTLTQSSVSVIPPNFEQANKAPSAAEMKSPENQVLTITTLNSAVSIIGNTLTPKQNELQIKSTECMSNALLQTICPIVVSPISTKNIAAGLNGLSEMTTECVTNLNDNVKQEIGIPQLGFGVLAKKITLEPQVTCGTLRKEESSTKSQVEDQEPCLKDDDLTLPLVKSSIFLVNNNDMPKGKDIPISLNASLDDFSLSDLQEKDDRMHGKVAELYNRNPIIFNVEHEPPGTFLKPQLKYYKSETGKNPAFYFDKIYDKDPNKLLKMSLAGKNLIFDRRPSYKSEENERICNSTLENINKLPNNEIEPVDSDGKNAKPDTIEKTTPPINVLLKSNVSSGKEQKYLGSNIQNSLQPANEEETLLTILNSPDKTTIGVLSNDRPQENFSLPGVPTMSPKTNIDPFPMSDNDDKVFSPQGSGLNNTNVDSTLAQSDSENPPLNVFTTKQPHSPPKPHSKPTGKLAVNCGLKPNKTKLSKQKTIPDVSKISSSGESIQEKNTLTKEKMCIPGDSVQKIVIEIVRNTMKPENKPESYTLKNSNEDDGNDPSMEENKEQIPNEEMRNIKQNFVPFQSAWKPVKTIDKQTVFIEPNSAYSNKKKTKDRLKTEIYEPEIAQEKDFQYKNNNRFIETQDNFQHEQVPEGSVREYSPFHQSATNHEKSLGANILKLLMADKSVVKSE